jgi:hypothetical protein
MSHKLSIVFFPIALAAMLPAETPGEFKHVQVTNTERVNFAPGGLIRLNNSYGALFVEAWDQPVVEITVIKSMPFNYNPEEAAQHLERVSVETDRRSDTELVISTTVPSHNRFLSPTLSRTTTRSVGVEYQIHVPRESRLMIRHRTGYVSVTGVSGDIEATAGRGDIMLWLPPGSSSPGAYLIDAKVKFGHVSSELEGAALSQYLIGQRFGRDHTPAAHRLRLRMGFGGITILEMKPESEAPSAASAK